MTWVLVETEVNGHRVVPMDGERVQVKLSTGKICELVYDDGDWVDPRYAPMRVTFINVTHWCPMEGK